MKKVAAASVVFTGLLMAADAQAQMLEWKDKGFATVNVGLQTKKQTVAADFAFPLYDETATVATAREVKSGVLLDAMGGVRVWRNLAVAVGISGRSAASDATVTASIPHPAFFDQPRSVTGSVTGMKHSELWTSVLGAWMFPITEKFDVLATLGPSVVSVNHEVVDGATITEAAVPGVTTTIKSVSKSVWGVSIGVDGRYMLTPRFGVGAFARYQAASVNLTSAVKLDVGGIQIGAGARVRF